MRDLPAVGANLHDHFNSYVAWRATEGRHAQRSRPLARRARSWPASSMRSGRSGPLSGISTLAGILVRSDPRFDRPDLQMNIFLWSIEKRDATGIYPHKWPGFSISPVHLRPEGRGRVSLKSPDPLARRGSSSSFSRRPTTWTPCSSALRLARKIAQQPALRPYIAEEVQPGPAVTSDEAPDRGPAQPRRLQPASRRHLPHGARAPTPWSIRGSGCTGCAASGWPTPRSCRRWSAATPTRPRS